MANRKIYIIAFDNGLSYEDHRQYNVLAVGTERQAKRIVEGLNQWLEGWARALEELNGRWEDKINGTDNDEVIKNHYNNMEKAKERLKNKYIKSYPEFISEISAKDAVDTIGSDFDGHFYFHFLTYHEGEE